MPNEPDLIIDFTTPLESPTIAKRKELTEFNNMDLGSGYPPVMLWVMKDGSRIPIPKLTNDQLREEILWFRANHLTDPNADELMHHRYDLMLQEAGKRLIMDWIVKTPQEVDIPEE